MTGTFLRQSCRVLLLATLLSGDPREALAAPPPPVVTASVGVKQIDLSWPVVSGAAYYVVRERAAAGAQFVAVSSKIWQGKVGTVLKFSRAIPVHRTDWLNASYVVEACETVTIPFCSRSIEQSIATFELDAIGQLRARNVGSGDLFGYSVAASADGATVAIGAPYEDCSCVGVDPSALDDLALDAGAVYVFVKGASGWKQQAYIKALATAPADYFGMTVALSGDGNTLAIGSPAKNLSAGEVHLFARGGAIWKPRAVVIPSNGVRDDHFGSALALTYDGAILAVGASGESDGAGAVHVYSRASNGQSWSQTALLKGSDRDVHDLFGVAVALDARGRTLAVGAERDDSAGAVDIYEQNSAGAWSHASYVRPAVFDADDMFGSSVALSADGLRLAVGAVGEDGAATGVNGNASDNAAPESGAAYLFTRSGGQWIQDAYVKASDVDSGDYFGGALVLDENGNTLAVSARFEDGSAVGVSGLADEAMPGSGAAFLFERSAIDGQWAQARYIKAPNTGTDDRLGGAFLHGAIALSGDGDTLVVPAAAEDGLNDATPDSGAVYLY